MNRFFALAVVFLLVLAMPVHEVAAQPNQLNLQGVLRTAGGDLVNGQYDMLFRFYASETANGALHEAEVEGVDVENGVYTVAVDMGDGSLAQTYSELWLGIAVGVEPEFDRTLLSSVVYALHAASAGGLSCTGCVGSSRLR